MIRVFDKEYSLDELYKLSQIISSGLNSLECSKVKDCNACKHDKLCRDLVQVKRRVDALIIRKEHGSTY